MAGLLDRISRVLGAGKDSPQAAADPRALFEDYFADQTEVLQKVRRAAANVASSRKLLAQQLARLAAEMDSLTLTAHRSVGQGRDDLAEEALIRKQQLSRRLAVLEDDHAQLQLEEERLVLTSTRLQAKLDTLRARHEAQWATYSAAQAQALVDEAVRAISADVSNAGQAVQSAASHTQADLASSTAVDAVLDLAGRDSDAVLAAEAAKEMAAIRADLAADRAVAAEQSSYQQPGQGDPAEVRDSWGAESGPGPIGHGAHESH